MDRGANRLVDPCCGPGTILLEAAQMGIEAVGYDINPKMVKATQANAAHYGLGARAYDGDARRNGKQFGAIVADLPYGMDLFRDTIFRRKTGNFVKRL